MSARHGIPLNPPSLAKGEAGTGPSQAKGEAKRGELAVVLDTPQTVSIGGETIELRGLRLEQVNPILDLVEPAAGDLFALIGAAGGEGEKNFESQIFPLFRRYMPSMIELMAVLTGRPREWIAALELDDAIELAGALWAFYRDFFSKRIVPLLAKRFGLALTIGVPKKTPTPTGKTKRAARKAGARS